MRMLEIETKHCQNKSDDLRIVAAILWLPVIERILNRLGCRTGTRRAHLLAPMPQAA